MTTTDQSTHHLARRLRTAQTPAEKLLWSELRNRHFMGLKFRRQHPIGSYVVDFYCPSQNLIIEIDGESHPNREAYDSDRTARLVQQGYRINRFSNEDVLSNLEGVLSALTMACRDPF
jgi:very-short-patch-repair endonuclease